MRMVIDIPDNFNLENEINTLSNSVIRKALKNGTPLPEHHGRLIDVDAIEYTHAIARCLDDGHNWNELCVTENELYDAPTIIPATEEGDGE